MVDLMLLFFIFYFLQKFITEATNDGLGWQRTDGVTFGCQVNSVEAWCIFMILLYERRSGEVLQDVVFFKLGIDSRCHWNRGGQVCYYFCL